MTPDVRSGLRLTIVLIVCFVILSIVGFAAWDQPTLEAVRAGAGSGFKDTARALSRYGDFPWLLGGGLIALAFCLVTKRRQWARIVTAMLLAGVIAGLTSNVVKLATGRVRPRIETVEHGWYGPAHQGEWVSLRHDFQAFPSSHAACAFGFFFPLFLSRRLAGAAGLLAAAAVAWSRVQLNAHHVSDVAAGALIGVLVGWMVWRLLVERGAFSRWLGNPAD
jgi:membrane-associated phospholipid phosphatase